MTKRSLPTVNIDCIFEVLVSSEACWYVSDAKRSKSALMSRLFKLNDVLSSLDFESVDIRAFNKLYDLGKITLSEHTWITQKLQQFLVPKDFTGIVLSEEALVAWENPKPKKPRISELKPGQKFKCKSSLDTIYVKLGNTSWLNMHGVPEKYRNTLHMRINDSYLFQDLSDDEVDVI